jgi:hypothetical protein
MINIKIDSVITMTSKTTHIRVEKETLKEMKKIFPKMSSSEAIKTSLNMYKGVQKAGKFMYGNVWKK